ncbi:putative carbohydrate-binding protein with CBM48 [Streptomyces sp. SLBN-118]|uniref:isoamylase early set domain-containing protein n=1 Tax=Streptomyces sp. SLBN-118 TaxID=2768454 RepID=UPI001151F851|nr:isoamylase early set domain-containing protein [Streptomyces sp. SLBN-118]TQK42689.1 putative carbohydrate-binding protein with CBM48 [Streptomyces sp. SLBN-118]
MLERSRRKNDTEITFVIPADQPCGQVSVVGDFNDWQPGAHPLVAREDGTLAVTLNLPTEQRYGFRYLAAGDYWFDDEHADAHDGNNSILHT